MPDLHEEAPTKDEDFRPEKRKSVRPSTAGKESNESPSALSRRAKSMPSTSSCDFLFVTVTDAEKLRADAAAGGPHGAVFLVTTRVSLSGASGQEARVKRRYADFVALGESLSAKFGGSFVLPRELKLVTLQAPGHKDMSHEVNAASLEKYLHDLAQHPGLRGSSELQTFLEVKKKRRGGSSSRDSPSNSNSDFNSSSSGSRRQDVLIIRSRDAAVFNKETPLRKDALRRHAAREARASATSAAAVAVRASTAGAEPPLSTLPSNGERTSNKTAAAASVSRDIGKWQLPGTLAARVSSPGHSPPPTSSSRKGKGRSQSMDTPAKPTSVSGAEERYSQPRHRRGSTVSCKVEDGQPAELASQAQHSPRSPGEFGGHGNGTSSASEGSLGGAAGGREGRGGGGESSATIPRAIVAATYGAGNNNIRRRPSADEIRMAQEESHMEKIEILAKLKEMSKSLGKEAKLASVKERQGLEHAEESLCAIIDKKEAERVRMHSLRSSLESLLHGMHGRGTIAASATRAHAGSQSSHEDSGVSSVASESAITSGPPRQTPWPLSGEQPTPQEPRGLRPPDAPMPMSLDRGQFALEKKRAGRTRWLAAAAGVSRKSLLRVFNG